MPTKAFNRHVPDGFVWKAAAGNFGVGFNETLPTSHPRWAVFNLDTGRVLVTGFRSISEALNRAGRLWDAERLR